MCKKVLIFQGVLSLSFLVAAENRINIYWADKPPVIDAREDDACWLVAEQAKNFSLFKKAGQPTRQTEVAVCYDADCLYLFWKLYDATPQKIVFGNPEDVRDFITWQDVAELFLDPGQTKQHYFQLAATPSGARFDLSSKKSTRFNPDWKVKGAIYDWGWALEMAIPFTELAHQGEIRSTPVVGEVWGINFCRDQASLHEWSQWEPSMMSFHEVKNFGKAVFCGRKEGKQLPIIKISNFEPLFFGPAAFFFSVESPAPSLKYSFLLSRDGILVEQKTGEKIEKGQIQIPYHITKPGYWQLDVSVYEGKEKIYAAKTASSLPAVAETLAEIEKKIDRAKGQLKNFQHEVKPTIENKITNLKNLLSVFMGIASQPEKLTRQQWRQITTAVASAEQEWKKLDFDLSLINLYPRNKKVSFAAFPVSASAKIYPNSILSKPESAVRLSLAGNEYESFQMALVPFWKQVSEVKVSFTDLTGPKKISRTNFSTFRVDYVRLKDVDPEDKKLKEQEPDILFPETRFQLNPGALLPVWVDFYLPADTPAGTYKGRIIFSSDGEKWDWPIEVRSYGFNLPRTSSLENQFWFSLYNWNKFYGGTMNYTPELYQKHAEILSRYRISSIPSDWITLWPKITVYYEPDNHFSFDFSTLDKFIKIGLENGSNTFWASLGCNLGSLSPFSRTWTKVMDRKTGQEITLDRVMKDWLDKFSRGKTYWDENPMYRDFLKAYVSHLKELGILSVSYWEIYDEPNDNSRWLDMIRHHTWLRQFVPELKLFNFGVDPTQVKAGKNACGLIDCWAPHIDGLAEPEVLAAMKERREKYGEKYWFYTCGERVNKDGNYAPFITYYRPYISVRIHPWIAWKYQTDGFFIYALSSVPEENVKKNPEERWPKTAWSDGSWRGCGTLIYPGPDFQLIPSIRLAHLRDGLEDYEYFALLKERIKNSKTEQEEAEKALAIEPEIIKDIYEWTKDVKLLEKKRENLAKFLQSSQFKTGFNR